MCTILDKRGIMHLIYDEEAIQYWEIKKHVPKNERKKISEAISDLTEKITTNVKSLFKKSDSIDLFMNHSTTSVFTHQDHLDMMQEYEELEREIYKLTCCCC